ncbi:hypothetical protein DYB32_010712, partial [Aphanomyces invadans]
RFKSRNKLVLRCETSSRVLPAGARAIANLFLHKVADLIQKHGIKAENVLNMDQVPRYFETDGYSTIIKKRSKNVMLRKGGSSQKRFTATFLVSMTGKIYCAHLLFSKLKDKPTVDSRTVVDVNSTGMWSDDTITSWASEILKRRPQTALLREPTLLLLDAYGPHIKLVENRVLEKHNIYTIMVPKYMTTIPQPLDKAIDDPQMQTKAGNVKEPTALIVSKWVADWADTHVDASMIKEAFQVCSILPSSQLFDITALHTPLRDLLSDGYDETEWHRKYANLLAPEASLNESVLVAPTYFFPQEYDIHNNIPASLWQCLHRLDGGQLSMVDYQRAFVIAMGDIEELEDVTDAGMLEDLIKNEEPDAGLLLFTAARKAHLKIVVINRKDVSENVYSTICNRLAARSQSSKLKAGIIFASSPRRNHRCEVASKAAHPILIKPH